jgi:hypothetical protein
VDPGEEKRQRGKKITGDSRNKRKATKDKKTECKYK